MQVIETLKKIKFDTIEELKGYLREGKGIVLWHNVNTGDRVVVTLSNKTGEPVITTIASPKVNGTNFKNVFALEKICDEEHTDSCEYLRDKAMGQIKAFFDKHDCCSIDLLDNFKDAPVIIWGDVEWGCPNMVMTSIDFEGRNFLVKCSSDRKSHIDVYSLDMELETIIRIADFLKNHEQKLSEIIEK